MVLGTFSRYPHRTLILGKGAGEWIRHTIEASATRIIRLPDSSQVTLLSKAPSCWFPKSLTRATGSELTEKPPSVERNTELPFIVYSEEWLKSWYPSLIRALEPGKPVEVDVQSGKVIVYRPAPATGTAARGEQRADPDPNQSYPLSRKRTVCCRADRASEPVKDCRLQCQAAPLFMKKRRFRKSPAARRDIMEPT